MMKIKKITGRSRRDFWAIYECEHCEHETKEKSGYDDANFHNNILPKMKCSECGKAAMDKVKNSEAHLHEDFGDVESMWNMRKWLREAIEAHGAKQIGAGMGMGEADIDFELEGHKFNVVIKPR